MPNHLPTGTIAENNSDVPVIRYVQGRNGRVIVVRIDKNARYVQLLGHSKWRPPGAVLFGFTYSTWDSLFRRTTEFESYPSTFVMVWAKELRRWRRLSPATPTLANSITFGGVTKLYWAFVAGYRIGSSPKLICRVRQHDQDSTYRFSSPPMSSRFQSVKFSRQAIWTSSSYLWVTESWPHRSWLELPRGLSSAQVALHQNIKVHSVLA